MANIFDYLTWRGDVPFSVDPFNEVDNLVLSELAYTDFDGIVPQGGAAVSLQTVCDAFFARHTEEELLSLRAYTAKAPLLLRGMLSGERFRDAKLSWYVNEISKDQALQLSAVTVLLPDSTAFVAFRGTDGTVVGWKEDFNFSFQSQTEGQGRAVAYLNRVGEALACPLYIGGHSKGGNLAVYAASFCEKEIRERILRVYSNDGPGFRREIVEKPGYLQILPKVTRIVPDTSVIGMLMTSKSMPMVVKSAASGIAQHDGFSWQVQRNRFEAAELTETGKLLEQTVGGWLEQMDDDARRTLTDTVFTLVESTGMEKFSEISAQKLKSAEAMLSSLREIPKENQQEVLSLFTQLGQMGGAAAANYLKNLVRKKTGDDERED